MLLVNKTCLISFLFPLLFLLLLSKLTVTNAASRVPCFFIFGDSLVDSGNNNDLKTRAKANYEPYGVDFPQGVPTGRFTNGLTSADFLSQLLGFEEFIPPFATAQGKDILKGVNYASGSAGILDESGQHLGERIYVNKQLENHVVTINRITELLGNETAAKEQLEKCFYLFVIGSNDYINNYFLPEFYPSTSQTYTPDDYATLLIQRYSQQIQKLYSYGARRIAVAGLGPIGCIPFERARYRSISPCVDSINNAVTLFNDKLKPLADELSKNMPGARVQYLNSMTGSPTEIFGIVGLVFGKPCCKVTDDSYGQCDQQPTTCSNRDFHLFYDDFHPTQFFNRISAIGIYDEISLTNLLSKSNNST